MRVLRRSLHVLAACGVSVSLVLLPLLFPLLHDGASLVKEVMVCER